MSAPPVEAACETHVNTFNDIQEMESNEKRITELPENAYRELKPGEEYKPVLPADRPVAEATSWSIGMGLIMAIIFSAAAAYSGLKIGQVFEAAIPISIIAVGASAAFRKKNALGQNVIIQSIGASSGVIVAGAVFTIPGLYILQAKYPEIQINFWQIFFSSLLGGFLGILFLIPFRKYFVKDMHGKLPFPEATATTEILMTGEKGGNKAKLLITSGLIGGLFDFCFSSFRLWSEVITTRVIPFGATLAEKFKMVFKFNVSALIFSFGYLVGLRFAVIITVGSLLSWLVLIPLVNEIGALAAASGGVNPFAAMSAEAIFAEYVRPIGIGAIAMAGIIGIIKSSGVIGSAFKLAVGKKGGGDEQVAVKRTDRDLKMSFVTLFLLLTLIAVFIFLIIGVKITLVQAIVALITITVIAFLFTTVAANAIAIVGSNPVSGMTLMTLILSSVVLVAVGLDGWQGMVSGLIIGGIVCTALSMAGGFITDLKIGYWIGSTPATQQSFKFLGTLVSAATVGAVIFILNEAYGFVATAEHPDPMVAPQANAMAAIIEPLMSGQGVSWMLLGIGAVLAILINWLGISPLAFALGMFIPIQLNTPLIVGGLLNHWINKSKPGKDKKLAGARHQRAILISSGFIAGAALFGVLGALIIFLTDNANALNLNVWSDPSGTGAQITALIAFSALITYFIWETKRAKRDD